MRNKRSEIERRMRIMADAKVQMLLGLYVWPDGRTAITPEGTPRTSNRELLRLGGYSPSYKSPEKTLFADPYFQGRVKSEMARREKAQNAIAPYDPNKIMSIRDLAMDELELRLRNEAESFTRSELVNISEKFEQLARSRYHSAPSGEPASSKMNQFNAFISRTVNVMNGEEKEQFVRTASDAAGERIKQIESLIAQANAVEEAADDCDVIDAEVCPL